MKVKIYSRKMLIKELEGAPLRSTAIISFCDPSLEPIALYGKCADYIIIKIHDLDPEALEKFGYTMQTYFSNASEVAEFIYKAREKKYDIICQCEYGQSRSAGCASAILEHFSKSGIKIFANYKYYPNQLIFNKLLYALNGHKRAQNTHV